MCWTMQDIPESWRSAEVMCMFNKDSIINCENYKGSSLDFPYISNLISAV